MAKLQRILGSHNLVAEVAYPGHVEVRNDFDETLPIDRYPFNSIHEETDSHGNKWVSVPKFYRHIAVNDKGEVSGRQVSKFFIDDDWTVNPVFINNKGEEVDHIEIAKYQMSIKNGEAVSLPGQYPANNMTLANAQKYIDKLNVLGDGYEYFLYDIWTHQAIQDLFVVEFAQSNALDVMKGYDRFVSNNSLQNTGVSDSLQWHTGYIIDKADEETAMKYRGIENIYGNGYMFIDGIRVKGSNVIVSKHGEQVVSTLTRPTNSGYVHTLAYDPVADLVFPKDITKDGRYGDAYSTYNTSDERILTQGLNSSSGYGLFSLSDHGAGYYDLNATFRVVRRPK